eukprot:2237358-Alexandrium_andersonii.AAC.1
MNESKELLVMLGPCRQHGAALCLRPLSDYLNVLMPSFCIAKQLHQGKAFSDYLAAMRASMEEHFQWIRESEDPGWRPDPGNIDYAEAVMELAYFKRNLYNSTASQGELESLMTEDKLLRERGARLLQNSPGDWRCRT